MSLLEFCQKRLSFVAILFYFISLLFGSCSLPAFTLVGIEMLSRNHYHILTNIPTVNSKCTVLVITATNLAKKCSSKIIPNQMVLRFDHDFKLLKIFPVVCLLFIYIVNCKKIVDLMLLKWAL